MTHAGIAIDGQELTEPQLRVLRMAVDALVLSLEVGDVGDRAKWIEYQRHLLDLRRMIELQSPG